jgi:hypothetical protein
MKNPTHRIWWTDTKVFRALPRITRNEYGDLLFHFEDGEIWGFTPHAKLETPPIERVKQCGQGVVSKTGLPAPFAFLVLQNPSEALTGNLRLLPGVEANAERTKGKPSKTRKRGRPRYYAPPVAKKVLDAVRDAKAEGTRDHIDRAAVFLDMKAGDVRLIVDAERKRWKRKPVRK